MPERFCPYCGRERKPDQGLVCDDPQCNTLAEADQMDDLDVARAEMGHTIYGDSPDERGEGK